MSYRNNIVTNESSFPTKTLLKKSKILQSNSYILLKGLTLISNIYNFKYTLNKKVKYY